MRKIFIIGAMFCLFSIAVAVSAQSNFAGDWKLDKEKSELGERSRLKSMTMNVIQSETELTVDRKAEVEEGGQGDGGDRPGGGGRGMGRGGNAGPMTYNLKGKETDAGSEAKLKAKVKDKKLELTQIRSFEGPMGSVSVKTVETWELSDEGKTLTISSKTETPRGDRSTKMVFTKD